MGEFGNPWLVLLGGAVPSIAGGLFVVWRLWLERGTKRLDVQITREERITRDTDARVLQAAKIDADVIARGIAEVASLVLRMRTVEQDRNRGWDLARWWYDRAHGNWRAWDRRAMMADTAMRAAGLPLVEWPSLDLPNFEAPFPPAKPSDPP